MLSPLMFIIGFIIFSLYMSGLLWMIKKSHDDQRKRRESDMRNVDDNDYDGGGNCGRPSPTGPRHQEIYYQPKRSRKLPKPSFLLPKRFHRFPKTCDKLSKRIN